MDDTKTARRAYRYFQELLRFSDPASLSSSFPRLSFSDFSELFSEHLFKDVKRKLVMLKFFCQAVDEDDDESAGAAKDKSESASSPVVDAVSPSVYCTGVEPTLEGSELESLIEPRTSANVFICVCTRAAASEGHWASENEFKTRFEPKAKKLNIQYVIPAILLATEEIKCPSVLAVPTFPRDSLEPQPHDASREVVGTFDEYRLAINELVVGRRFNAFDDYLEAALMVYRRVTGKALRLDQNHRIVVVADQLSPMIKRLYETYDVLGQTASSPPLIQQIFGGSEMDRRRLEGDVLSEVRNRHIAMVDRRKEGIRQIHALDRSQRLALHRYLQLGSGSGLIAVNGPPGTGKTDMLRAIIANVWVTAALNKDPCPIIIACGATNQSVENVMSAFEGAADPYPEVASEARLENRWITGIADYGFASPSSTTGKIGKFQLIEFPKLKPMRIRNAKPSRHKPDRELRVGYGRSTTVLIRDFIARYSAAFCDEEVRTVLAALLRDPFADAGDLLSVVQRKLHDALVRNVFEIAAMRARLVASHSARDVTVLETCISILGALPSQVNDFRSAFSKDPETFAAACETFLDVTIRPASFHLAARYWEAEWLATNAGIPGNHLDKLRRFSLLGPCIVSTLHSAPKIAGSPLPFGKIDLVIVDEAGQGAVELGIPALAFAHQAIVVGDLKQLSPIVQITDLLDERLAIEAGLTMSWLEERRLNSSASSIMAFAARASSYGEDLRDGLLLRNHYRCARSIIEFCRELMYNEDTDQKELQPVKPDHNLVSFDEAIPLDEKGKAFPIPPMAFVQCGSVLDEPRRTESWYNEGEKRRIVEWVDSDGRRLLEWYRKHVDAEAAFKDVIAIVTPFRAQASALKDAMDELLGKGHKITVGTVHALQGAEKPVVLFSAVSRPLDNGKDVFFDKDGGRLLNVAVSRAKDAFILFGHSDLFFSEDVLADANSSRKPSLVLGRYMAGLCMPSHDGSRGTKILPRVVVVVESDHKARQIEMMLPIEFQVFGTGGHIRDIRFGTIKERDGFLPPWELSSGALTRLKLIGTRLLQTPHLIIATDPDEQGEAIGWHVLQVLKHHPNFKRYVQTVSRVIFTEIEDEAIKRSFSQPLSVVDCRNGQPEDALAMNFVRAALAQRVIDNFISGHIHRRHGLISGRVRAPMLSLIAGADVDDECDVRLEINVLCDHRAIPARIVSIGNRQAGRSEELIAVSGSAIRYAQLESTSCLLLESPQGLSTLEVLKCAFLRFGMLPSRTMTALQRLYEERSSAEEAPDSWSIPLAPVEGVAARMSRGHVVATDLGQEVARRLRKVEPYICSLAFGADVEKHLDDVRASATSYADFVESWSLKISGSAARALPPEASEEEVVFDYPWLPEITLLPKASLDLYSILAPLVGESDDDEAGRGLNLHPSLTPLALPNTPSSTGDVDGSDEAKIHSILVGRLIASAMHPVKVRIRHHALDAEGLPNGFRIMIDSYEIEEEGWLVGDPGARRELEARFVSADALPALIEGRAIIQVVGVHRAGGLESSRLDGVLDFMKERDIGQPSTYAAHIDALLNSTPESYSTINKLSSISENELATNQSDAFPSLSMST